MKNNKGFAPILILIIALGVLVVGGGAYFMGKSASPASKNIPENNYKPQADQNSVANTPAVNSNTANGSFSILSPKGGDQWVIGKKYSISLSQGLSSDYHPMLYTLSVANDKGGVGMICPDLITKKGESTFNWVAGELWSACTGTNNVSINMSQGQYQILFGEMNLDGTLKRTIKSGWFSLTAPTTTDETLNWKTYTNTQYGFEFKYPEISSLGYKYKLAEVKQNQTQYIYSKDWSSVDSVGVSENYKTDDPEYKPSFRVIMINITNSFGSNFKNYVENQLKSYFGSENVSSQYIDISGDRWVEVDLGIDSEQKLFFIFHNEKIYSMSLDYTAKHSELEKITSTFKFTK